MHQTLDSNFFRPNRNALRSFVAAPLDEFDSVLILSLFNLTIPPLLRAIVHNLSLVLQ